jgi:Bacterial Ig domain
VNRRGLGRVAATALAVAGFLAPSPIVRPASALLSLHANDDTLSTRHDRLATVAPPGVLGNDLNLLGGTSAVLDSTTAHGTLHLAANGGYTYLPVADFVGTDAFRYHDSGLLPSNTATVTITVTNAVPVGHPDGYTMAPGTTLNVAAPGILANDTDADGDALRVTSADTGGNGSLDVAADGSFTFKPGGSFSGVRTFTYRASDGLRSSGLVTVSITVGTASPTPTPTPVPTPAPTPTPTPAPTLPLPSLPVPSVPLPSVPLPTLPLPTAVPTPTSTDPPTATPVPTPTPASTEAPAASPPEPTSSPSAPVASGPDPSGGPITSQAPGADGSIGGPAPSPPEAPFVVGVTGGSVLDPLGDMDVAGFGGFIDWAVPALVLSVPGLLLVLAVLAQTVGAVLWVPLVRRWLGGFGVRRRRGHRTPA